MNLKQLLAGFEAAVPAVGQIVTAMHPENTSEGVKIAAGVELFKLFAAGVHQIAAASETSVAPTAPATPEVTGPNA